jgi:hypothetical protein
VKLANEKENTEIEARLLAEKMRGEIAELRGTISNFKKENARLEKKINSYEFSFEIAPANQEDAFKDEISTLI